MNKRKLKKSLKRAKVAALQNQNEYLKHENVKLRRALKVFEEKSEAIAKGYEANVGTLTRLYGDQIEGYSIIEIPTIEVGRTILEYEVKCSVENDKYVFLVMPRVDSEE